MSKEQYEWVVAMALLWGAVNESADQDAGPKMERVDGIAGRLAPNAWEPSNDGEFAAALAALTWLLLAADLQKRAAACAPCKILVFLVQNQTQIYSESAHSALFFCVCESRTEIDGIVVFPLWGFATSRLVSDLPTSAKSLTPSHKSNFNGI
ncbi:MAG: hypothetical protein H7Z39_04185 [Burkholderiaceae bacterium]|nr:hypothetical protein [Burkholderiaceae bacterium]